MIEGLDELVADLQSADANVLVGARAVVQRGSLNVKRDAQRLISGLQHAPQYPASITYETSFVAGGVEGEIGPDKDRAQGALGNLLEYGSVNNAPFAHLGPALDLEGPRFEDALGEAGLLALEGKRPPAGPGDDQ